jgi:hypothetical protein
LLFIKKRREHWPLRGSHILIPFITSRITASAYEIKKLDGEVARRVEI